MSTVCSAGYEKRQKSQTTEKVESPKLEEQKQELNNLFK
jgi:hypothetical protein